MIFYAPSISSFFLVLMQCQRRPNADAERSPSASPPQRVDDIELLCDGGGRQQRASVAWALAVRSRPRVRGGSGWGRG